LGDAEGKKIVVFGPGVYDIGYWKVPNNVEHIHLEGGAIVYGTIDVLPLGHEPKSDDYLQSQRLTLRPDFRLTGHGILSGRKIPWHMTKDFDYCLDACWWKEVVMVQLAVANITVTDITIANSPQFVFTFLCHSWAASNNWRCFEHCIFCTRRSIEDSSSSVLLLEPGWRNVYRHSGGRRCAFS